MILPTYKLAPPGHTFTDTNITCKTIGVTTGIIIKLVAERNPLFFMGAPLASRVDCKAMVNGA